MEIHACLFCYLLYFLLRRCMTSDGPLLLPSPNSAGVGHCGNHLGLWDSQTWFQALLHPFTARGFSTCYLIINLNCED